MVKEEKTCKNEKIFTNCNCHASSFEREGRGSIENYLEYCLVTPVEHYLDYLAATTPFSIVLLFRQWFYCSYCSLNNILLFLLFYCSREQRIYFSYCSIVLRNKEPIVPIVLRNKGPIVPIVLGNNGSIVPIVLKTIWLLFSIVSKQWSIVLKLTFDLLPKKCGPGSLFPYY